ncbi:MAG: phosphoribosylglycinamide formyltransferase [Leptolyngbya sp. PLA3]|nr:MAG: phosphoribosylglycinamide formyltransferase [Cyanobacteria bacterium CYA]MCE7970028.1 phosphoribosylglycinamide formyltransferase [Leptolyngbya sp. PL-A3]
MTPRPANLLVLLSGSGRTLMNLADAIDCGQLPAQIQLAVASKPCLGEERARARGFQTRIIRGVIPPEQLARLADEAHADWIVLAGYVKMVLIPDRLRGRVVNIHPALLPDFGGPGMYGHRVHEAVLASGRSESGCTVHFCDDRYDTGPIILQRRCPVLPGDTPDTLAARVFDQECLAYPEALRSLIVQQRAPTVREGS